MTLDEPYDQPLPVVTSYISKAHYGIVCKVPFDKEKHSEEDRKFDSATNMDLAWNQMRWYVKKVRAECTTVYLDTDVNLK